VQRPGSRPETRREPPSAARRHGDYGYVEGYGWWPRWFPYWDASWVSYWQSLYDYYYSYYGDEDAADDARDAYVRDYFTQQGAL
jgi:hypothetical protein